MRRRDVYGRSAEYYDALYEGVDYAGDVKFLQEVFRAHAKKKPARVMDIGAGTGNHALLLAKRGFKVEAVDISEPLLDVLQRKAKERELEAKVRVHHMDMTRELPQGRFDAAVSMFGVWCYARTDEEASRLLSMLGTRLPKGGLFVFEFWSPLGWKPSNMWADVDLPDGTRVLRLTRPKLELRDDVYEIEFEHLVIRDGRVDANFSEVHGCRLRTPFQTQALLERNGFEVRAFAKGDVLGKSLQPPGPNDFRVMAIAAKR